MGVIYRTSNRIGTIVFNNPATLNALDFEVLKELEEILDSILRECLAEENSIDVLILTGAGEKAFVAGGDISVQSRFGVIQAYDWACTGHRVLSKLEKLPIPVIAAVNGYALGGGTEVVLACDLVVASEKAIFGQPEVSLGITPGFGGTQRLPRKIGSNRAKEWIMTGRRITASEALNAGLVNRIAPSDMLMDAAVGLAHEILANGRYSVRMSKTAVNDGIETDLETGLSLERSLFSTCFAAEEQKERMTAFMNRKK